MVCEMEDLLSRELLDVFAEENPGSMRQPPVLDGEAHHYEFNGYAKATLLRFAKQNAILEDVSRICDVLKAMRYAVGLPIEGHTHR